MSAESGWGSSLWGYGKYGVESNVDASATINGVATISAAAIESLSISSEINAAATVSCAAGQVYFGATQVNGVSSFSAVARFLWEAQASVETEWTAQAEATTTWTKQVA